MNKKLASEPTATMLPKMHPEAYPGLATDYGKEFAVEALKWRQANQPKQINNADLYAGSPMYYYCRVCGWLSDTKPEGWFLNPPAKLCRECSALKEEYGLPTPEGT